MRNVYAGEVHNVAAGYARNYLLPEKMAVYATPNNFDRCGLIDPEIAAKEEAAKLTQLSDEEGEEIRAADLLRRYLRNKTVRLIRNVDPNLPTMCHPGHVDTKALRVKLSKQFKIDLEEHEIIHIRNEPVKDLEEMDEQELLALIKAMRPDGSIIYKKIAGDDDGDDLSAAAEGEFEGFAADGSDLPTEDCDTKVKKLGEYVARIILTGGHTVPMKFRIERR